MCAAGRPERDTYGIRIAAGTYSDAYLQRADVQRGYTLVIWRGRHVAEPTELTDPEAQGYWLEMLRVARALQRHYQPLKLNYQVLGKVPEDQLERDAAALRALLENRQ
jgi:diadenosine tetraphosphate (Ap4A) HIT family hydrolase